MTSLLGFLPNIGPLEIGIVLVVVLLIFGPKRIPDVARSVGQGFRNFKNSVGGDDDDEQKKLAKTKSELQDSEADSARAEAREKSKTES